jgi:PAS domain S-box-containing protein
MSVAPSPKPLVTPPPAEQLLSAIVDSSDDAILSKDLDGIITSWNKAAERIFGYTAAEIIGKSVLVLLPADRKAEEADILSRVRRGERVDHFETVRMTKEGKLVEMAITESPIKDPQGMIVGASKVARDISALKHGARADLLLAAIVNSSEDAIISKGLDGIITSWNSGAERIFGYAPEEIVGHPVLKLIPPGRREEEPKIIDQLRRGIRVDHFETVRVRKNGEHFPVSLTISPVRDASGNIVGASKIARDITEVQRAAAEREQLLASERNARAQAEKANRMKDEFLSTVSHELRTPLNAIVGWTEVLAEGDQNREEIIHGIEIIRRNAMIQAQLIEDLLDLGRISSGKMALEVTAVDIGAVISEAMGSVSHAAQTKQIAIVPVIGNVRGLQGDAKRLQQVIWNVLTNAIKFTPKNGKVVVRASRVNSHVEISVADSGQGIAPEFIPHLFERFRQEDSSITRTHGGLGIGLALVKQLIELHGGSVRAESPGANLGSTFTLSLPVSALQEDHRPPPNAGESLSALVLPDLQGIRVLAVDDDRDSLELLRRILGSRHAEVETASSVEEAMAKFGRSPPDVVLSDIGMPGKDGYDLIRLIRQHPSGATTPAAALTALARADDRTRALTAGFQSHVAKPVAPAEVVAMVHSLASLRSRGTAAGLAG